MHNILCFSSGELSLLHFGVEGITVLFENIVMFMLFVTEKGSLPLYSYCNPFIIKQ